MHAADVTVLDDGEVRIVKVGPMGPGNNNAYIVRDLGARESLLVDMPLESRRLVDAIAADGSVKVVVATHWHPDHWASYDAVRTATGAPVLVGAREVKIPKERIDGTLDDGDEVRVGTTRVTVIHTPGHTPGSISLRVGRALISGDTLFDGGPGRTFASGDLEVLLESIGSRLLPLDDSTMVLPGHGGDTTIGDSRRGFAAYQQHPKPSGYHGDVTWE